MKYITVAIIMFIFTMPLAMANSNPSLEQLAKATHQGKTVVELNDKSTRKTEKQYKATHQGKTVVELIDKSTKNAEKQICFTNIGKGKVKEMSC